MQNKPALEVMQCAIRAKICPQCYQRPAGSETLPPTTPRACQEECTIFRHLPEIKRIAQETHKRTLAPYERAVREMVCQTCDASPTAGDFCADRSTRRCPLSRYLNLVVETLDAVVAATK